MGPLRVAFGDEGKLGRLHTKGKQEARRANWTGGVDYDPLFCTSQKEGPAMSDEPRERQEISEPVTITLLGTDFQPSKADMEEEFDMPGMSLDEIRAMFFRPFRVLREES